MPKDKDKSVEEKATLPKEKIKEETVKNEEKQTNSSGPWVWVLGAVVILLFAGMTASAIGIVSYARDHRARGGISVSNGFVGVDGMERGIGRRHMMFEGTEASNQSAISGVVTSVNGNSFVVAGNGTTNTVQTDSNTQYSGDTKVSVNDSVTVIGTTSNSTFTATQIVIRNAN